MNVTAFTQWFPPSVLFSSERHGGASVSRLAAAFLLLSGPQLLLASGPDTVSQRSRPESRPYLQVQKSGLVEWHAWGPRAFAHARRTGKPIFLSVVYPACYWCGVMEREVFADPEIATLMNDWFVNIRVNRQERPDVDRVYLTAAQLLSGRAGWPVSVFLTPDLRPFFAGTYFPRWSNSDTRGFGAILSEMRDAWRLRRAEVLKVAARVSAAVTELEAGQQAPAMPPDTVLVQRALAQIKGRYDDEQGGFGTAPKFPPCVWLEFLLADAGRRADPDTRRIVERTMSAMDRGAIHDHVHGGFYRYAADAAWHVPQFEKMLYTQAGLARCYLDVYELTGNQYWRWGAEKLLDYVASELTGAGGGFWSGVVVEHSGEREEYYLWTSAQLESVLDREVDFFRDVYALGPVDGASGGVLFRAAPKDGAAADLEVSSPRLQERLDSMLAALHDHRRQRLQPAHDRMVVTAWHAMMIRAYTQGYVVTGKKGYLQTALRGAEYVETKLRRDDGQLVHFRHADRTGRSAFLQDYAQLIRAYAELSAATVQPCWRRRAEELATTMVAEFWDEEAGGFFLAPRQGHLFVRSRNAEDGVLPAANAAAVHGLLDLAALNGNRLYTERASATLTAFGGMMRARPLAFVHMVAAAERYLRDFAPEGEGAPALYVRHPSLGPEDGSPLNASVDVQPDHPAPGQYFRVFVHLTIRDGWYLPVPKTSDRGCLFPSLELDADLPVDFVDVECGDGNAGEGPGGQADSLRVYRGRVTLRAAMRVRTAAVAGDSGDLRIRLRCQPCNAEGCRDSVELFRRVPLQLTRP